jgi:predicted RNase H-like nuclease (RuvC/YqgF family)
MGTLRIFTWSARGEIAVGFLAEMQREAERRRKAEEREQRRVTREYEKTVRDAERQAARDEKERKKLHVESRARETERLNAALEQSVSRLENLLAATLRRSSGFARSAI